MKYSRKHGRKHLQSKKHKRRNSKRVGGAPGMFNFFSSNPCDSIDKKVEEAKKAYDAAVAEQEACKTNDSNPEGAQTGFFSSVSGIIPGMSKSTPAAPAAAPADKPAEPADKPAVEGGKRKRKRSRIRKRR